MAKQIPDGFHSVNSAITVRDGAKMLEFYRQAFGAEELMRMPGPDGKSDRKSTRLNSSHSQISYAVFCLKKKKAHYARTAAAAVVYGGTRRRVSRYHCM